MHGRLSVWRRPYGPAVSQTGASVSQSGGAGACEAPVPARMQKSRPGARGMKEAGRQASAGRSRRARREPRAQAGAGRSAGPGERDTDSRAAGECREEYAGEAAAALRMGADEGAAECQVRRYAWAGVRVPRDAGAGTGPGVRRAEIPGGHTGPAPCQGGL
jgi:hypothetical protein